MVADITPQHDSKLQMLLATIAGKIAQPINPGNKRSLFSQRFPTRRNICLRISAHTRKENYGLNTALVTGSVDGWTSVPKFKADLNNILTCFSPISRTRPLMPDGPDIDILIATDCISEGRIYRTAIAWSTMTFTGTRCGWCSGSGGSTALAAATIKSSSSTSGRTSTSIRISI